LDPAYVWAHKEFGVLYEKMGKTEQAIREYDLAIAVDPDYKFAHANKGNLLRSLKRYHEALKALDEAIRIDDNYKWAIHERGLAYFNLNQFETAIIDFEQVVALDPRYKWAYANIGKCAWELKRYEDAEKAFGAALDIDPNYNWVLRERGELYLYLQKYSDALMDFSQTIITEASTSEDYYDRARSYQKMGVALEKENRYDERQGVLRKARADLEEALKLEPGNPDYLWYLGVAWHDMYAYDRAEEIYLQAIENNKDQDSQDVAILWWNIAKSRNQWGLIVKDPEQHQKSVAALALAKLKLSDPIQSAECLGDQGQAYLALNDYVQAIKVLSHACTLDPANAQLLYLKGKAEYLMGDIQGAEETFAAVLDLKSDPSNYGPSAWVGRGLCAEAQNKSKQAEEAFKQALGENKETAGAFLGRADAFEGLQAFARSAEDLEKAIELEPENANALNSLSWLYAEKLPTPENLTRAIQYGERAIKSQVEFFWRCNYLDTLGWACYKAGKYGEAVKYIIEALNSLPEPFEIRYHREQAEDAIHAQGERS
jgi:tetratricopeptide (TPR) repeat protein